MKEQFIQSYKLSNKLVLLLLLALTGLYLYGVSLQNHLANTDPIQTDQLAYLTAAKTYRETRYNYILPRSQMPVYPLLQSLIYKPGMSDETFFVAGKEFNIILSLAILAFLYWLFQHYFPPLMTLNLMLITGFTIFMFKAPFFQTELLFYLLNFIAFLLALKLFRKPTVQTAVLTGLAFGAAHMTKASVIPGLGLCLLFMGIAMLLDFLNHIPYQEVLRQKARPFFLLLLVFLASISVYMINSKRIYGDYLYNVNTTFYIWYNNWPEAKAGTIAHGDQVGWPDMPADDIPSPTKYFQEHTPEQILGRFQLGLLQVLSNSFLSYGYFFYFLIYTLLFFTITLLNWRRSLAKIKPHLLLFSFVAAYFLFYLFAVAWYSAIASGNRFILAYFLPYMFVLFYALRSTDRYFGPHAARLLHIVNLLVLCILTGHIYYIMTDRIATFYGGL